MRFRPVSFLALALVACAGVLAAQAPTPEEVSREVAVLVLLGLGAAGSAVQQAVKRLLVPFDRAPAWLKGVITMVWGVGLAWLAGAVPWLAALLPSDPGALSTAAYGLLLGLVMAGVHSVKRIVQRPDATGQEPAVVLPSARRV